MNLDDFTKSLENEGPPSDISETLKSLWWDKKGNPIKGWKRIYKTCKPTKWILDYWK